MRAFAAQAPQAPWFDLSTTNGALSQEMLAKASGGILFAADLAASASCSR